MDHHVKKAKAQAAMMGEGSSGGGDQGWTEERHASFLNRMEESFVRTMLSFDGSGTPTRPSLRLDRYVPDSATESTSDSHQNSGRAGAAAAAAAAALMDPGTQNLAARNHNIVKKRLLPQREYNPTQDQVVPQYGRTKADEANVAAKNKKGGNIQVSRWL